MGETFQTERTEILTKKCAHSQGQIKAGFMDLGLRLGGVCITTVFGLKSLAAWALVLGLWRWEVELTGYGGGWVMGIFAVVWTDLVSLLHCSGLLEACHWLDSRSSLDLLCPSSGSLCPTNCKLTENALTLFLLWDGGQVSHDNRCELLCTVIHSLNNLACDNDGETLSFSPLLSKPNQPSLLSCPLKSRTPALCPPWWPSALLAPVCKCPRIGCSTPDVVSQVLNRGE